MTGSAFVGLLGFLRSSLSTAAGKVIGGVVAVALVGTIVGVAAGGGSSKNAVLTTTCPKAAASPVPAKVTSTTTTCNVILATSQPFTVQQVIYARSPDQAQVGFAYCDGQTCGNEQNANCVSNLNIPSISGLPALVDVQPPPAAGKRKVRATSVIVGSGATGSIQTINASVIYNKDGSVLIKMTQVSPVVTEMLSHFDPTQGRICGFNDQQLSAFEKAHPHGLVAVGALTDVRLAITWTGTSAKAGPAPTSPQFT